MQPHSSEAIVLKAVPHGESNLVVSFLCREQGLLRGFAPGGRNSRKRFGPALESFSSIQLIWTAGRGDLVLMKEADLLDLRTGLRTRLPSLALAAYACELVEKILPHHEASPEAFLLLHSLLDTLNLTGASFEVRMLFELRLLRLCGYEPHLLHCSECLGPLGGEMVLFEAMRGGSLCGGCAGPSAGLRVSRGTLGSLARCLHSPLEAFAGFRFGARSLSEGGSLLSACVREHLHGALKSLSFLDKVMPAGQPAEARIPGVRGDESP